MQRLSTWAALRCKEEDFQRFLRAPDEPTAIRLVRAMCDIQSRRELDTSEVAAHLFHQLIRLPYQKFLTEKENTNV
jgi:hypothetical protein